MNSPTPLTAPALDLAVRVGCELVYETSAPTPALVTFKPRQDAYQSIRQESMRFEPELAATEFEDDHLNIVYRLVMKPGRNALRYDAIVMVPSLTEDFAWKNFGHLPHGLARVRGICDWLNKNIEYRTLSGSPNISAYDVIERRYGVCRDLAHTAVALCRSFNLPARYVSGYVPEIAFLNPGVPNAFHAYCEVWMGGRWPWRRCRPRPSVRPCGWGLSSRPARIP